MGIPAEYEGREQTFVKHEVLRRYLERWAMKLSSRGQHGATRLWYVDCFAGPWNSKHPQHRDTSVAIGLDALEKARETWEAKGVRVTTAAIFVEKDDKAYTQLRQYVQEAKGSTEVHVWKGQFGERVGEIAERIRGDPAFLFVDPTGWKGVAMDSIAPLVRERRRDVFVNLMYEHIKRFKGDRRPWLREQMCDFFGIDDNEALRNKTEEELLELYRTNLKDRSSLEYSLNLAIPFPQVDRTYFHLVVGGHHPDVVQVFRDVEHEVFHRVLPEVKEDARRRRERASGQELLDFGVVPQSPGFASRREAAAAQAREMVLHMLHVGPRKYGDLWSAVLERFPLSELELRRLLVKMEKQQVITVSGRKPRERTVRDPHTLALGP